MSTEAPAAPSENRPADEAPPPSHPTVVEALAAFEAGDHRRARTLLDRVPADATLDEGDRAAVDYLRRALSIDPMIWIVGVALAGLWLFLFWRVAFA